MTIRRKIIERTGYQRPGDEYSSPTSDEALIDAVEWHFRGLADFSSIDGFADFYVLQESTREVSIMGRTYFLGPYGLVPMKAKFRNLPDGAISYKVLLGKVGPAWEQLSEKKRWAAVYLHATEGYAPPWEWDQPLKGLLAN